MIVSLPSHLTVTIPASLAAAMVAWSGAEPSNSLLAREIEAWMHGTCRKCGGPMHDDGKAIEQTYSGTPDFSGGEVVTVSAGGPGRLVDCRKCGACGWSVTG